MKCVLFPTSSNPKTGDIIQAYSAPESCPARCPFKGSGCYGENFHTRRQWARADNADDPRAVTSVEGMARALVSAAARRPEGAVLFRHNVAGDMAEPGTSKLDAAAVRELHAAVCLANSALNSLSRYVFAYTYTHCEIDATAAEIIRAACITINASCETAAECKNAAEHGVPSAMACADIDAAKAALKAEGLNGVQCPAQTRGTNCDKCRLCARKNRKSVILFALHGNGAKKAARAIYIKVAKEA